ncbi:DUF3857 and transglutaminase domain-containing protein [Propionivibrio sp.]|uniref:DUF3857 domain-containing transglutaminase family protein n=1 Tax=Propionivibrio sp. TaxID=2212460 RepID=UPI00262EF6B1|nr:DUF3857 and transglutaminase domain-containing protein [Propionivibrio sp.]
MRVGRYYESFLVNEDGTAVESLEWSKTVLKETALERSKRAIVSYSTSAQTAEVIAAYTLKADGRRIDVPKDNYQVEVNRGQGKDSPVYSDWTTLTVVFPEVAVGDSVVLSYKVTQTEPMFPQHYSTAQFFSNQIAFDDLRVRFDYPASMWVQYEARGMKEAENRVIGDRKIIEWRYANERPVQNDRRDYTVFDPDQEIGYAFSTFKTYADIATAYGARALPKAVVTERIAALATEIVKGKAAKVDQARALYEWVAKNITYAGNCIGVGAVVPRDVSFVIDNKMGDCKDHATLLQALLTAQSIKSTQALVNAGSVYRLPKIPVVANVNHVITYLPEFDEYADSTSDSTPFGMLPFSDQDKPVLLVEGFKEGAKTPVAPINSNREHVKSAIKIAPDGSASGSIEVVEKGEGAVRSRAWARKISKDAEEDLVKNVFRGQGMIGYGKFEKDDPTGMVDSYHYKASLNAEKFLKLPGPGAFYISPPLGLSASIAGAVRTPAESEKEADVTCSGGSIIEEYVIELPKALRVLSIPNNAKLKNEFLSYAATYVLKGKVLTVKRTLDDHTKGNVCSPQYFAEYKKIADKVMDNLKEQVLYK